MYVPRRYEEKDKEKIFQFIRDNSFGVLISVENGVPIGTHTPLLLEENTDGLYVLTGHISRGNGQGGSLKDGVTVLVIFQGPHSYISPRWYSEVNVPTWNYISVHIYGLIRILKEEEIKAAMSRLVDNYEKDMPFPVTISEIPQNIYTDKIRGIIIFEISIDEIQAAYKLSQSRDEESYTSVIEHLQSGNETAREISVEMKNRMSDLYPPEK